MFEIVELFKKEQAQQKSKLGSWWQERPEGDRHHVEKLRQIKAIVDTLTTSYTIIDYLTGLRYWVGK